MFFFVLCYSFVDMFLYQDLLLPGFAYGVFFGLAKRAFGTFFGASSADPS